MGPGAVGWLGLPGAAWLGWFDCVFCFLILFVFGNLYSFDDYPSSEDCTLTGIKCEISVTPKHVMGLLVCFEI